MSTKDLKAFERHFIEEYNKGKAAAMAIIDEICTTNFVYHGGTGDLRGLKEYKQSMSVWYDAFPDFHMTIDDMLAEGDKVVVRYTMTGTHKGEFMGIPATNKKVKLWVIQIDRVAGGKRVEGWMRLDSLGMMQQLGLAPAPAKK